MKIIRGLNYFFVVALGFFAVMFAIDRFGNRSAQAPADTVLYTEEYCKDIIGYHSYIPLEIKMVDGKIAEINILDNDETPRFMRKVTDESLVEKFYGLTPAEAMRWMPSAAPLSAHTPSYSRSSAAWRFTTTPSTQALGPGS